MMISIDIHSSHFDSPSLAIEVDFIDWKAVIAKSLAGEKISVKKSGVEVLQINPVINPEKTLNENTLPAKREFGLLRGKITVPADKHWGDAEVQAMFDESLNREFPV